MLLSRNCQPSPILSHNNPITRHRPKIRVPGIRTTEGSEEHDVVWVEQHLASWGLCYGSSAFVRPIVLCYPFDCTDIRRTRIEALQGDS
jgi:hypothetical protein